MRVQPGRKTNPPGKTFLKFFYCVPFFLPPSPPKNYTHSKKISNYFFLKLVLETIIFYSLIRMSEQVIKVTTTIDVSFSDLSKRMTKKKATAIWNILLSISKRRHVRYTVEAQEFDFVRDVIVDAVILEAPINTSDSDSDSTFSD